MPRPVVPPQARLAPCQLPQGDALGTAAKFAAMREADSPSPSSLRDATSPKGRGLGIAVNFAFTAKSRPLGEGGLPRSGKTEGVTLLFTVAPLP